MGLEVRVAGACTVQHGMHQFDVRAPRQPEKPTAPDPRLHPDREVPEPPGLWRSLGCRPRRLRQTLRGGYRGLGGQHSDAQEHVDEVGDEMNMSANETTRAEVGDHGSASVHGYDAGLFFFKQKTAYEI